MVYRQSVLSLYKGKMHNKPIRLSINIDVNHCRTSKTRKELKINR